MIDDDSKEATNSNPYPKPALNARPFSESFQLSLRREVFTSLDDDPPYLWQIESNKHLVASLGSNRVVKLHDRDTLTYLSSLEGHSDEITDIAFDTKENSLLCCSSRDGYCSLWDTRTAKKVNLFENKNREPIYSVCSNGAIVVVGGETDITFWDVRTRKVLGVIEEIHVEDITQVYFHPKSPTLLVSGSEDGVINVYNMNVADPDDALQRSMNCEEPVLKLGFFGPSSEFIYAVSKSDTLSLFDIQEAERISHFTNLKQSLSEIAQTDYIIGCYYRCDSDKLFLCTGSNSGNMLISQISKSSASPCEMTTKGHTGVIRDITWMDTEQQIISVGEDARICQWKAHNKSAEQFQSSFKVTKTDLKNRRTSLFNPY